MKKNTITIIGVIILVVIVAIVVNVIVIPSTILGTSMGKVSNYDSFAKCLTEKKAVLYGASWCPHCQIQKKMFGSSIEFIKYVECSTPDGKSQTAACKQEGISAYPTWKFNGRVVQGQLDLAQLSKESGCSTDLIA